MLALNNNLENKRFFDGSLVGNLKAHVGLTSDVLPPFESCNQHRSYLILIQHILFTPCNGVGTKSFLEKLVINVNVHQVFNMFHC